MPTYTLETLPNGLLTPPPSGDAGDALNGSFTSLDVLMGEALRKVSSTANSALIWAGSFDPLAVGDILIGNRGTAPTSNPSAGGVLYVENEALKYRGAVER